MNGLNRNATQATATSRADMPVMPARRPAAICGSEPSTMPTAATITTWNGPAVHREMLRLALPGDPA